MFLGIVLMGIWLLVITHQVNVMYTSSDCGSEYDGGWSVLPLAAIAFSPLGVAIVVMEQWQDWCEKGTIK